MNCLQSDAVRLLFIMSKSRKTKSQATIKCHTITSLFNKQVADAKSQEKSVSCPVCKAIIPKSFINKHLDSECLSIPVSGDPKPSTDKGNAVETASQVEETALFTLKSPELKKFYFEQKSNNSSEKKQKLSLSKRLLLKKNMPSKTTAILSLKSPEEKQELLQSENSGEIISNFGSGSTKSNFYEEIEILTEKSSANYSLNSCHDILDISKVKRQLSFDSDTNNTFKQNSDVRQIEGKCSNYEVKQDDSARVVSPQQLLSQKNMKSPKNTRMDGVDISKATTNIAVDKKETFGFEVTKRRFTNEGYNLHIDEFMVSKVNTVNVVDSTKISLSSPNSSQMENIKSPDKHVKESPQQKNVDKSTPSTPLSSPPSTPKSTKSIVSSPRTPITSPGKQRPYYLEHFLLVLKSVTTDLEDSKLFNEDDIKVIDSFFNMSVQAQQLYVRIFQRKHQWIPLSKLDYKNIAEDLNPVLSELCSMGFLDDGRSLSDLSTTLELLSLPDLKTLIKVMNIKTSATQKTQIVEHVLQYGKQQRIFSFGTIRTLSEVILKRAQGLLGQCFKIRIEPQHLFFRCLILFSLTSYHDEESDKNLGQSQLLTLLFVNMGKLTFPQYYVVRDKQIFRNREDLIEYEVAYRNELKIMSAIDSAKLEEAYDLYMNCKNPFQSLLDNPEVTKHVLDLPKFLRRFTAGTVYSRCLTHGVEVLQKQKNYKMAVEQLQKLLQQEMYNQDYRGRWFDRLALNLEQHLKLHEKALLVIKEALQDSNVRVGHRLALYQRAVRICNSKSHRKLKKFLKEIPLVTYEEAPKVYIQGRHFPQNIPGYKSVFLSQQSSSDMNSDDTIICSVEEVALNHYMQLGFTEGIHGESSTFLTLYGLLFWDIIYQSGYPDVFRSPHQALPLDIYTDEFYVLRKADILERQKRIETTTTEELMLLISETWTQHNGATSIVSWNRFENLQQIEDLISCIGGKLLSGICERFAKEYRYCHSGFPDLVVWNVVKSTFKIVEVKGPRDRLSPKQVLWLDYLLSLGVDAEVCHVEAVGHRKLKRKLEEEFSQEI